jgi:arginyl-tRNA synthetase
LSASAVQRLAARLAELAEAPVELERPQDPSHGDFATNVALQSASRHKRNPREYAAELADRAAELDEVERGEVAGPGFVNLWVTTEWLAEALAEIGPDYGGGTAAEPQKIQVELISANPAGPLTVGSARNGAYGDSVARLLDHAGHQVEREYYFNDVGRQMELFRESVEARRRGEDAPEGGYQGAYISDLAQVDGDPVEHMLGEIRREVAEFRIPIDTWRRQAEIEQKVAGILPQLDTYEAEGTLWARTSAYGDDKDRPLVRSDDGSYLYFAADVAYVQDKLERGFDRAIYVLGADHHGYIGRLKAAAAMLGYDPERIEALIYQLVHIVEGGRAKRISKRRGDVVFLHELIEKIGIDASRWYLVSRGHDQPIDIDVDLAEEPGLLRAVRARAYCGDPQERGRRRGRRGRAAGDRAAGTRPDQAADGLPQRRCRGGRTARAARDPDLCDSGCRRLPPLLPRPARRGVRVGAIPACALPRHAARDRSVPRSDWSRSARADVGSLRGTHGPRPKPGPRTGAGNRGGGDGSRALDRPR